VLTLAERNKLKVDWTEASPMRSSLAHIQGVVVRAVPTGKTRPPKKGEWFLSGAIVEAYRTNNDLSSPYQIARLVKLRRTITVNEVVEATL